MNCNTHGASAEVFILDIGDIDIKCSKYLAFSFLFNSLMTMSFQLSGPQEKIHLPIVKNNKTSLTKSKDADIHRGKS